MNSHFYPGRTTPETMVGGIRKWEQLSRTAGKQSLAPYGDGYETPRQVKSRKEDSESDQEPTEPPEEDDQYTEQHYSESEFHTEQEEDDDEQADRNEHGWSEHAHPPIQVSQYPPKRFEQGSHLLHIDFITDELGRFELPSSGQSRGRRPMGMVGSGATGRKSASGQQQSQQHNISFSRERVREIERTNQILLRRIITTRPTLQTQNSSKPVKRTSSTNASPATSAATNRRKMQEKIAAENEILLRKVNSVGSRLTLKRMTS
ncbi:uncharacterized protein LOC120904283 [Anopheles arabiensis]|uniref:Uncharacterized protein n=1 Tax=Anopheles arabiensis TaxID=7173 RepID=A0A1I8JU06_ANOAR|nr:uncharacterized protein LOC120904283 [Anopheles arabiensis]XP_040170106.1 uncharacterized protein LOC120904283 [Anopheles arabiensis]